MIDAKSSAFAAQFASLEGCRKLAGHNLPGNRPFMILRPGGALERSSSFVADRVLYLLLAGRKMLAVRKDSILNSQSSIIVFCPPLCLCASVANGGPLAANAAPSLSLFSSVTDLHFLRLFSALPFNSAFLVQFCHHAKSPLTPYISVLCAISAGKSLKVNKAKRPIKNSPFFSGHFEGKSLGNQEKTTKKTPQNWSKKSLFLVAAPPANAGPNLAIKVQADSGYQTALDHGLWTRERGLNRLWTTIRGRGVSTFNP